MSTGEGKALRALLPASERRALLRAARKVAAGLWQALDALDDLCEDAGPDTLTPQERFALKSVRNDVLAAFSRLKVEAPDLTGIAPLPREVTG